MARQRHLLPLVLGPIIWAGWFVTMYAGLSVACNVAPPELAAGSATWLNGALLLLTLLVSSGLLLTSWRSGRRVRAGGPAAGFVGQVSTGAYLLAAVATLAIGLPVTVLPPCI